MSRILPEMRAARRDDLEAIKALLADDPISAGRESGADETVAAAFDEIEQDGNSTIYVLERDGRIIGCAQLTIIAGLARRGLKRGLIEAVRVASDLRGQGLGRDFIRRLVEEARARGCGVVQLTSDKRRHDAHRFYLSLGFAMSHEGFKLDLKG
jgi:GNAT superfamily N-acetyltransferase